MADVPPQWNRVRDLSEGGQAHTFVVRRADGSDSLEYVLKRLKNPKRTDYFDREIKACQSLNHPNVLKIIDHGYTPNNKPYLVSRFCEAGSLENREVFKKPIDGLRLFLHICAGVAHAHNVGISHLDLKPANIFMMNDIPVVGDFGICFIEDDEYVMTSDGPRGSVWYCAPELRNRKVTSSTPLPLADIYSLGKVLYWIFTHAIYDGHQDDYSDFAERHLANLFPNFPDFAFVDELVEATVQRDPNKRSLNGVPNAASLQDRTQTAIDRIEAGGRVLDLRIPQVCLYCGKGKYQVFAMPPSRDRRSGDFNPNQHLYNRPDPWHEMRSQTTNGLGVALAGSGGVGSPVPVHLICDYCGNMQQFRLDRAPAASNNWLP
jgi:serine/threonine protein kinase